MGRIVTVFEQEGMTHTEYDAIMSELKAQDKEYNKNRLSHVTFGKDGKWCVIDVWESEQSLMDFIQGTLGPIFQRLSIPTPQPKIYEVYNYLGVSAPDLVSA